MKILLTGACGFSPAQIDVIRGYGHEVVLVQEERLQPTINVGAFEAVVCNALFLYNDVSKFKNLRMVQVTSVGTERLPLDHFNKNKIVLFTAKGVYSVPMAEWAVTKILEICKKSKHFFKLQEQRIWQKQRDLLELSGKMAIIAGFGNVGQEIAKRLLAFGVEVKAIDKQQKADRALLHRVDVFCPSKLDELLPSADILVLSLPLEPETTKYVGNKQLSLMKHNAILVNLSRGGVLCQDSLVKHLGQKKFFGVALDVFDQEPLPPSNPLWQFENVIVTPHIAFVSEQINKRLFELTLKNLNNFFVTNAL